MRQTFVPLLFAMLPALAAVATAAGAPAGKPQGARAEAPATAVVDETILSTLRPQHPRLYLTGEQFAHVKQTVAADPLAAAWEKKLEAAAVKMLDRPPVEHVLIGPRLLDKSRTALQRVSTLAGLYRLNGDKRFAERARKELLAVSAFDDWNPSHFLDVAEMTNACAVGYDWLFDYLSEADRQTIRRAIVEKGLKQALPIYEKHEWWSKVSHNWNQVCNGGITAGALAIGDEEPDITRKIVSYSRASIPLAMASFAPDGGWAEGPGYWGYATEYNVFYLAAIQTALGTDFGLGKTPGFAECGEFPIQMLGPTNQTFDFADAHAGAGHSPQLLWLARTFNRPAYDAFERKLAEKNPDVFDLLWFNAEFSGTHALDAMPDSQWFKAVHVALLRSDRQDSGLTFVGFKGGDNKANHAHLDLGTFVLDTQGERWAIDMGADEYNMPGYFGKQRWTYYRLRTEGHNTITLDGENQNTAGKSPVVAFSDAKGHPFAVADLTNGYHQAKKMLRGIEVDGRGLVIVQDEIETASPVEVVWNFHTDAKIDLDGPAATLTQGKAKQTATILSPAGVKFESVSANPPPPQHPAPNTKNLFIRLPSKVKEARIVVVFTPGGAEPADRNIRPLAGWAKADEAKRN